MFRNHVFRLLAALAILAGSATLFGGQAGAQDVKMTFYGNQHFRFVSTEGKVIVINPWIKGNADSTIGMDFYKKGEVDLILVTSGHGDDQGQAVEIAAKTGATIFAAGELVSTWGAKFKELGGNRKQLWSAGVSGRFKVGNVMVQTLPAAHGSGARVEGVTGSAYGGPALGFLITFENGLKVLMAGSTGLSMELQLMGMRFKPHIAMVPIMGRFMMHPDDAAFATKLLMTDNPNLKTVIPQHFRVKKSAPWMGTPAQFEAEVKKLGLPVKVLTPPLGQAVTLTKG